MRRSRQRLIFTSRRRSHRRLLALLVMAAALTAVLVAGAFGCSERRANSVDGVALRSVQR